MSIHHDYYSRKGIIIHNFYKFFQEILRVEQRVELVVPAIVHVVNVNLNVCTHCASM